MYFFVVLHASSLVKLAASGQIWVIEPESGAVLTSLQTTVRLALELEPEEAEGKALSACLGKRGIGTDYWEEECFPVGWEGGSRERIKVSETVVKTPPGWSTLEARLLINERILSTYAIATYAPQQQSVREYPKKKLGIAWDLGGGIGWGVLGLQVSIALIDSGILPIPLRRVHGFDMSPHQRSVLADGLEWAASLSSKDNPRFPVIHALGRWGKDGALGSMRDELWSTVRNIGILFAETRIWSKSDLMTLTTFDQLLLGSSWCADALREAALDFNLSLPPHALFLQGVDTTMFFPATAILREDDLDRRFRIFSGGKLEWRKGHDIVLEAFKRFIQKRPEAKAELVVAWTNPWPLTVTSLLNATHTLNVPESLPDTGVNATAISEWLKANDLSSDHFISLPALPHKEIPKVLRTVDAALFPNRVEGGTNLVAMETAAAAIPTILSATTGHLDLLNSLGWDIGAWALRNQSAPRPSRVQPTEDPDNPTVLMLGGESDPDEAVAALDDIFLHRSAAHRRAYRGAKAMQGWTWQNAVGILLRSAFSSHAISNDTRYSNVRAIDLSNNN